MAALWEIVYHHPESFSPRPNSMGTVVITLTDEPTGDVTVFTLCPAQTEIQTTDIYNVIGVVVLNLFVRDVSACSYGKDLAINNPD